MDLILSVTNFQLISMWLSGMLQSENFNYVLLACAVSFLLWVGTVGIFEAFSAARLAVIACTFARVESRSCCLLADFLLFNFPRLTIVA